MIYDEEFDEGEIRLAETLFSDTASRITVTIELSSGAQAAIDFSCGEAAAAILATREIWPPALAVARVCGVDAVAGELLWCRILESFPSLHETSADVAKIAFGSNISALVEAALSHEPIAQALFATPFSNGRLCAAMLSSLLASGWLDEADYLAALYCTSLNADEFHWTFSRVLEEIMSSQGAEIFSHNAKVHLRAYISESCAEAERAALVAIWSRLEPSPQKPSSGRALSIGSDVIQGLIEEQNQVLCAQNLTRDGSYFIGLSQLFTGKHPSENDIFIKFIGAPAAWDSRIPLCWLPLNSITAAESLYRMGFSLFAVLDTQLSMPQSKIYVVRLFCDFKTFAQ